jgi:hypothetical protein
MLHAINSSTRTSCGFSSIIDLATGEKGGRMPSYFLGETLKYLYLLFDSGMPICIHVHCIVAHAGSALDNVLHQHETLNFVFSTEAHILFLPPSLSPIAPSGCRGRTLKKYKTAHASDALCPLHPALFSTLTAHYLDAQATKPLYPIFDAAKAVALTISTNRSATDYNPFLVHYGSPSCADQKSRESAPSNSVTAYFTFPIDELTGESLYMPFLHDKVRYSPLAPFLFFTHSLTALFLYFHCCQR